jgi:Putative Flp pilus-assembly TadE/G-like/von Willebrand factor type A domain
MGEEHALKQRKERGQTIILVALALVALIAFAGLATDVALVYVAKGHLQRAIDAAALAAANKLPNQAEAQKAAYEFTRLHGYHFDPASNPLTITFPTSTPPRKLASVSGTVSVDLGFLKVIGWKTTDVTAEGMGESAPLDVFLVLDLSNSMAYDTPMPSWWNNTSQRQYACPQTGCPLSLCNQSASSSWNECRAYYCDYEGQLKLSPTSFINKVRNCDPLDAHIKNSAKFFVDQLDPRYDRVGVIRYDRWGWEPPQQSVALTADFTAVKNAIDNLDAFEPYGDLCTNIGDGILFANHYLSMPPPPTGVGGRDDSVWSIILLTDGRANMYRNCTGCPDNCGSCPFQDCNPWTGSCAQVDTWAEKNAWSSWNNHKITIYTIGYGQEFVTNPSYQKLIRRIADITDNGVLDDQNGKTDNSWAVPDEAGLRQALAEIAERIYTRLLR